MTVFLGVRVHRGERRPVRDRSGRFRWNGSAQVGVDDDEMVSGPTPRGEDLTFEDAGEDRPLDMIPMPLRPRSRGHTPEGAEETLAHADALYNLARYLTEDPSEAEDLVQETYLRALRGWSGFARGTNLKAWLFRILRNAFTSRYRQELRHPAPAPYDTTEPPLEDAAGDRSAPSTPEPAQLRRVLAGEIEAALRTLSEDARTVILLDLEGLTESETAMVVGCAVGTVKSRLNRARAALRTKLADYARDPS
jgi:RNA polymerase sigma-70 factor (ECF subfamily)